MGSVIRAFGGTLAEAQGILAVERATFDESPYGAGRVQSMLAHGPLRAWLALETGSVTGFVIAFLTHGPDGPSWEIDLLAVHPDSRGQGLATRLIQAATAAGADKASSARAVVATDNNASAVAFRRAGFRSDAKACQLFVYRPQEQSAPSRQTFAVSILETPANGHITLLAEKGGQPVGQAELIEVQTLLYRGLWIESLQGSSMDARQALIQRAVERAPAGRLDEVGAMVPEGEWLLRESLVAGGFRSLGEFRWVRFGYH
jgi:ribosomal protein S18 acetylase RimI-like enzyme